jgi:hypothetical protein
MSRPHLDYRFVLHLDRTLSPRTPVNLREYSAIHPEVYKPWRPGGGAARYLLCLSDSACSAPDVSRFFHFCFGLSLHPCPCRRSSCSVAKTPFASLLTHQSGIQAERRKQHEQRMRWAVGALIRCPRALPAPRARVLAIELSFPYPRPNPWL